MATNGDAAISPGVSSRPPTPISIPDFRRYWLTRLLSQMAVGGMFVILGYQLYDLARGAYHMTIAQAGLQLGLLGLFQFIPAIALSPFAGVVADRFDRRKVAGLALLLDATVSGTLAITTHFGIITLPMLFALATVHGIARVFMGPAQSAIAPNIVPAEQLPRAIAMSSIAFEGGQMAGPALGGVMFALAHELPYWVATAFLLASAMAIFGIRPLPPPQENRRTHPLRQMRDGFAYVLGHRFLFGCVSLDLFAVLLGGATALLPVFARDVLTVDGHAVGAWGLGLMRAAPAVGAASVAVLLSRWPITRNVGARMLWAVAAYGAATLGFGLSRDFVLSLVLLTALGAADMVSVFIRLTLIQIHTPDAMRGRVSAITSIAISASNELGEMESGVAVALLGATGAVVFGGAGAILVTALWAWLYPEIRRARTFSPAESTGDPAR